MPFVAQKLSHLINWPPGSQSSLKSPQDGIIGVLIVFETREQAWKFCGADTELVEIKEKSPLERDAQAG